MYCKGLDNYQYHVGIYLRYSMPVLYKKLRTLALVKHFGTHITKTPMGLGLRDVYPKCSPIPFHVPLYAALPFSISLNP